MTWASIVKKQADPQIDVPKQVLIVDPKSSDQKAVIKSEEQWRRILPEELPDGAKIVVLDTGAFLRAPCIQELGDLFYTTQDVLNEIRDVQHREALQNIMAEVVVCSPNDEAIRTVLKLTTETGDIGALSRTDLRVLAVAYQLAKEANVLRTVKEITDEQREYADEEDDEEEEDIRSEGSEEQQYPKNNAQDSPCESQDAGEIAEIAETSTENAADDMDHEDEDEDSSDWITPENIHVHQAASGHEKIVKLCNSRTEQAVVSCLTVDFSMQNALLHLGIPVLSIDGRAITRVRTWIFRCHACFTLVQDTSRQFCPACGSGNTLRKVSYTVDAQGNRNVWINWRKRLNTRGIRYNLPKPRWGAHGTNRTLVLREDQLRDFKKTKSQRQILQEREKQLKDTDGLFSKKKNYGSHALRERSSYARYNINERRQIRAARKK